MFQKMTHILKVFPNERMKCLKTDISLCSYNKPLTYKDLQVEIDLLINKYPFIKKTIIGYSVLGKEIVELRIGPGQKCIHYNASFHGNEWITTIVIMRFLAQCAKEYDIGDFNSDLSVSIVPMVNPDGVDLVLNGPVDAGKYKEEVIKINEGSTDFSRWKANIKGVDLNKQFPAGWEIEAARKPSSPHFRDYPGVRPLSEPESIAMATFAENHAPERMHALHTQGEEIYWGFDGLEPEESEGIAQKYAEKSGYSAVRYVDNYAGFKDWYIKQFKKPGFTLELGRGTNPLPLVQLEEIWRKSSGFFTASLQE